MTTRITDSMISRTVLSDLQNVAAELNKTQQKMSSGKELTKPSDNPYQVSRALQLRDELDQNQQYQRNVDDVNSWQTVTDTALGQIADYVQRARELLIQGGTDSSSQDARNAIATEITQLIDSLKTSGNAKLGDRYVFAGSSTLTAPYQIGGADTYSGNTEVVQRQIGPGVTIDLNVIGQQVLGDDTSGLLASLRTIVNDLQTNNGDALRTTDIQSLDASLDTITSAQAVVGARQNRLDAAGSRLQQLEESTTSLLSNTEDADMAETIMHYSMQQAVYQSALRAGAEIIQPSLMDYLTS
jgi:flagellar hook-associated protein 3 FlgL